MKKDDIKLDLNSMNTLFREINKKLDILIERVPDKTRATPFIKPTEDEVRQYCKERKNSIDPKAFIDHYEANNWKRGKTPIKDWKACVRTWEHMKWKGDKINPPKLRNVNDIL